MQIITLSELARSYAVTPRRMRQIAHERGVAPCAVIAGRHVYRRQDAARLVPVGKRGPKKGWKLERASKAPAASQGKAGQDDGSLSHSDSSSES